MTFLASAAGVGTPTPGAPPMNTLNIIPTYDGSGLSIHPSVVDMGAEGWNGYRWWMADTPYPNKDDSYENPSVFASHDRVTWEVPPGVTNPLMPTPPGYPAVWNSDTELVWDAANNRMVCFWRTNLDDTSILAAATSTNGADWPHADDPWPIADLGPTGLPWASPSVTKGADGTWRMLMFGLYDNPRLWTAADPLGPWTPVGLTSFTGPTFEKWHGDFIAYEGIYVGLVASRFTSKLRPLASADGVNWVIGDTDLLFGTAVYRPTLIPSTIAGKMDVWYSTLSTQRVTYTRIDEATFLDLLD